jgi:hypothetical protein
MKDGKYDLEDRLISFAVRVIRMVDALPKTFVGKHVSQQLARSRKRELGSCLNIQHISHYFALRTNRDQVYTLHIKSFL